MAHCGPRPVSRDLSRRLANCVGCIVLATLCITLPLSTARGEIARGEVVGGAASSPVAGTANAPHRYQLPLQGVAVIVHPFTGSATPYSAGHRGVDLRSTSGMPVFASATGIVTFSGSVAGRGVVVLRHPDGILTEYEPVLGSVHVGMTVAAGTQLGVVSGQHGDCPVDGCLHWGARRGDTYLDPMSLLHGLGSIRLVPMGDPDF